MKQLILCLLVFFCCSAAYSQEITVTVDSFTGDSTISTGFDTLSSLQAAQKNGIPDRVVGVKTIHKGESKYWLFFYFSTSDITENSVKISKKNFAYFVLTNNEYLRLPYTGRASNYSGKDNAGFFIDVTGYLNRLSSARTKLIRFETSTLYHEIEVPEKNMTKISEIVKKLMSK